MLATLLCNNLFSHSELTFGFISSKTQSLYVHVFMIFGLIGVTLISLCSVFLANQLLGEDWIKKCWIKPTPFPQLLSECHNGTHVISY